MNDAEVDAEVELMEAQAETLSTLEALVRRYRESGVARPEAWNRIKVMVLSTPGSDMAILRLLERERENFNLLWTEG